MPVDGVVGCPKRKLLRQVAPKVILHIAVAAIKVSNHIQHLNNRPIRFRVSPIKNRMDRNDVLAACARRASRLSFIHRGGVAGPERYDRHDWPRL
jgi:hypothetical protein